MRQFTYRKKFFLGLRDRRARLSGFLGLHGLLERLAEGPLPMDLVDNGSARVDPLWGRRALLVATAERLVSVESRDLRRGAGERARSAETGYSDMERLKYAAATLSHDDRQVARPLAG